ncbi:hypothetical protein ACFL0V_00765, partial [Nanoarchaeota archaeon]
MRASKGEFTGDTLKRGLIILLLSVLTLVLTVSTVYGALTVWHPLSEVDPRDVDLDMADNQVYNVSDLGVGTTTLNTILTMGTSSPIISVDTSDASDNKFLGFAGGGATSNTRGAHIYLHGNEHSTGGVLKLKAGYDAAATTGADEGDIILYTGTGASGTERMRVDKDGKVGIGTTVPWRKLHVEGGGVGVFHTTAELYLNETDQSPGSWRLRVLNDDFYLHRASNDQFTGYSTQLFIDGPTGDMGIGQSSTSVALDVDTKSNTDGFRLRGTAQNAEIADMWLGTLGQLIISTVTGTDSQGSIDLRPEDDGYGVRIIESDGTGTNSYANLYVTDSGSNDYLTVNVNSVTDGDALVVTEGNDVGIGTTSPQELLDVYDGNIQIYGNSNDPRLILNGSQSGLLWTIWNSDTEGYGFHITSTATSDITSVSPELTLQSSGEVGINTNDPTVALDVDTESNTDGLRLRGTAENAEIADMYLGSTGQFILSTVAGTDTQGIIDLRTEDDEYGVVIRESDGTGTNPYANLYVTDSGSDDYLTINVNSVTDGDALVVTEDDNIGVGTTTPLHRVSIGGPGRPLSMWGESGLSVTQNGFFAAHFNSTYPVASGGGYGAYVGGIAGGLVAQDYDTGSLTYVAQGANGMVAQAADLSSGWGVKAFSGGASGAYGALLTIGSVSFGSGGVCIDDGSACAYNSAGDGDVEIWDGGLCIGTGTCNAPADGAITTASYIAASSYVTATSYIQSTGSYIRGTGVYVDSPAATTYDQRLCWDGSGASFYRDCAGSPGD